MVWNEVASGERWIVRENSMTGRHVLPALGLLAAILGTVSAVVWSRFTSALRMHRSRIDRGSQVVSSRFGQIEFATVGRAHRC